MEKDIYDGRVVLKVNGQKLLVWEYPTRRELLMILEDVQDKLRQGKHIDEFEFRRDLKIQ